MSDQDKASSASAHQVPEKKKTSLGLYVTAREAYGMWLKDPAQTNILDVRTPDEYIFIGHAEAAQNIPLIFLTHQWNAEKSEPVTAPNVNFIPDLKARFNKSDTLLVICRSGGRSAVAVNMLAEEGFEKVYNIIDGMEGDKVDDSASVYHGKRMRNGWKNSGAEWTYDINPECLWTSAD
jgi:rhodanese-related sulfurtransferase